MEINSVYRYVMDNNPDIDMKYFHNMISLIEKSKENNKSDYSKIFLYLLEKEIFPQKQTLFKSIEYLDSIKEKELLTDKIEIGYYDLFELIKRLYYIKSNELKHQDSQEGYARGR